jgi:hypothetical protein
LINQSTPKDIPGRQTAGDILMKDVVNPVKVVIKLSPRIWRAFKVAFTYS